MPCTYHDPPGWQLPPALGAFLAMFALLLATGCDVGAESTRRIQVVTAAPSRRLPTAAGSPAQANALTSPPPPASPPLGQVERQALDLAATPDAAMTPAPTQTPIVPCASRMPAGNLLALVTLEYGLSPHFEPTDLVLLARYFPESVTFGYATEVRAVIVRPLLGLIRAMRAAGLSPTIISGYRSYAAQAVARQKWQTLQPARADLLSAPAGHSEHQLGTSVDFGSPSLAPLVGRDDVQFHTAFSQTGEGQWLAARAHEYGFTLSYPPAALELTGFVYEPWHFRYVGAELATQLRQQGRPLTAHLLEQQPQPCDPDAAARPLARISLPSRWQAATAAAIASMPGLAAAYDLQLLPEGEPAELRLAAGSEEIPAGRCPVALSVPFSTPGEGVSAAEAKAILAAGRAGVTAGDWAGMPAGHKALRVDGRLPNDPAYPLVELWSLAAEPGWAGLAAQLAPALAAELCADSLVQLAAVGDVMLGRALGRAIESGDLAYPFARVTGSLRAADFTVANLESALGDRGEPAAKSYTFQAPPAAAESLAAAGIDLVSLANNHALDYGPQALLEGIDLLGRQGIVTVGAGANADQAGAAHIVELNGIRIAFLAFVHVPIEGGGFDSRSWAAGAESAGLAWGEPEVVAAGVAAAALDADVVVVLLHSGYEYRAAPSSPQAAAARAAVDAGADLVIGHHAHVLQGVEFYRGGVIVYGLGNFAFEIDGDARTAILNVWLDKEGVRQIEFTPAVVQADGQPRPANAHEAAGILATIYALTDELNGR